MKSLESKSVVLLHHHLKKLRLPTVAAECEKVARQAAADNVDHLTYLLQLLELELGNDKLIWPHLGHLCRSEVAPPPSTTKPYVSGSEEPPNEGEGDEEGGALRSYPT